MSTLSLFNTVCALNSKLVTERYSTSFSSAIKLLHKDLREPIYNIYGFVRFADEIVDTFHHTDKAKLLSQFKTETYKAIEEGISLNPILHSFQRTVNRYNIDHDLIEAFFYSMELDLTKTTYTAEQYQEYIYGSAEVVGLMCLFIFCEGNKQQYQQLKPAAQKLGAAFQKVNFLRDIKADKDGLNRLYFPNCDFNNFSSYQKQNIEKDVEQDFKDAYAGILQLPVKARFGVYVAYKYYLSLFEKIRKANTEKILNERVRIPDYNKLLIVFKAGLRAQLNLF